MSDIEKQLTIRALLDAGAHFGHQVQRWNPKMKPYVFGERNGIHIINLQKTLPIARKAYEFIKQIASNGQQMLFVGTKKQAIEPIQKAAKRCEQFYITKRWLGGTMTNFRTIKASIDRLRKLEIMKEKGELEHFGKKELTRVEKEISRLQEYLSGIRDMREVPSALFVVDIKKEHITIAEARKLKIPVVGIADTNIDPTLIDFPIPGNDDSIRSITLFTDLIADAYLEGQKEFKRIQQSVPTDKKKSEDKYFSTKKTKEPSEGGPTVIKVSKRKLVAVGTADEMEIDLELTQKKDTKDTTIGDIEDNKEDTSNKEDGSKEKEEKTIKEEGHKNHKKTSETSETVKED